MNFYQPKFLAQHCQDILGFYDPRVVDNSGGYFQSFLDDGTLFEPKFRQLVSSTRIVINYALAGKFFNNQKYLNIARHGLDYVENIHWDEQSQRYAWTLQDHQPLDMTQQAYGYAFVLLMYAACRKAGIIDNDQPLINTYRLLEQRFFLPEFGLYADEISAGGELSDYRGQNANMHICEGMISAFEATNNQIFIERAKLIAHNIAVKQAAKTDGLIWEHFSKDFQPDWQYNKNDPKHIYRPWGFQPGHQTEWSQMLILINRYAPDTWLTECAKRMFDAAYDKAWDHQHGGLFYGFAPDGSVCDDDKYFWVQSESFAAAAMLYELTKEEKYLVCYNQIWQYAWQHMIDHKHGAWFRILYRDNSKMTDKKSSAGAKCDFHTIGACIESLRSQGILNIEDID